MRYLKPPKTFEEQADLLIRRGMVCDRELLVKRLKAVNYYRLSAYWHTFRIPGDPDDKLQAGTSLETVWGRYVFDRQLRLLVLDAIERVEVAVRTDLVNRFTLRYGAFGHLDRANLPGMDVEDHKYLLRQIGRDAGKSREDFVKHYFSKYTSETDLPLWMAVELMTFGATHALFKGVEAKIKKEVAGQFGVGMPVFASWMNAMKHVRNDCAHHARLWNRTLDPMPLIPEAKNAPEWHAPLPVGSEKLFGMLTILHFLLKQVAPQSQWCERLRSLFQRYPEVPLRFMGFPDNWETSPLWSNPAGATQ